MEAVSCLISVAWQVPFLPLLIRATSKLRQRGDCCVPQPIFATMLQPVLFLCRLGEHLSGLAILNRVRVDKSCTQFVSI